MNGNGKQGSGPRQQPPHPQSFKCIASQRAHWLQPSTWISPIVLVPNDKLFKKFRPCIQGFSKLNTQQQDGCDQRKLCFSSFRDNSLPRLFFPLCWCRSSKDNKKQSPHLDTHIGEDVFDSFVRAEIIIEPQVSVSVYSIQATVLERVSCHLVC